MPPLPREATTGRAFTPALCRRGPGSSGLFSGRLQDRVLATSKAPDGDPEHGSGDDHGLDGYHRTLSLPSKLVSAALSQPILEMVAKVYVPVLFPLTFGIAMTALWMDAWMDGRIADWVPLNIGQGFLPEPANWGIAAGSFLIGALAWIWTYQQLSVMGDGSPSPTAGRTKRLVVRGIYAYSRNPSVFGKLLGVLSVGFVLNSFSFCFILVPALLAVSLIEKVWRQEPQLIEIFGEDYVRYRDTVPLFVPWGLIFPSRRFSVDGTP
jgi:protein-S-isoprenylcysteine O-methyltransferase Ste14